MNSSEKLNLICRVPDAQLRMALLAEHKLFSEAWMEVETAILQGATFFFWHESKSPYQVCKPLLCRMIDGMPKLNNYYIVCHPDRSLERHAKGENRPCKDELILELQWIQEMWGENHLKMLAREIFDQTLARPISQWTENMALGTMYAVKYFLNKEALARQLEEQCLLFWFNKGDFSQLGEQLSGNAYLNKSELIRDMISRLKDFGWTDAQVGTKLLQWIYIKDKVAPVYMAAVAQAIPEINQHQRRAALHRYGRGLFAEGLLNPPYNTEEREDFITAIARLARMGMCDEMDTPYIWGKLVEAASYGRLSAAVWILRNLGNTMKLLTGDRREPPDAVMALSVEASEKAAKEGRYGIANALRARRRANPRSDWEEAAALLRQQNVVLS